MNILSAFVISGGSGVVSNLLMVLVVGIAVLLIWWVGTWFIAKLGAPAIARTVWDGLFILVGLFVVVNFLLGLAGRPIVAW